MAIAAMTACGKGDSQPAAPAQRPVPAAAPAAAPVADRKYLLERVDDAAVVQVYADGFDKLPAGEKTLIWHLYEAALAGRDIYYDQRYAHSLEMREHPRGDPHAPGRDRSGDADRDPALHQAVLDE